MTDPKRYLITSALPYANGLKHIGHLAGAYLPADIYVRYLRAQKRDVVFACGSDEHGAAITIQAMKEGTTPRAIVDKYHEILKQNFADLGISFDVYHRTTDPLHHETAQEFFTVLNNNGDLEEKESEQFFDEAAQTFLADRYIIGTCPVCGNPNAYGDQCEKCGSTLSPEQLINPRSTLSGNPPIKKLTKHWYLPLNRHEDFLRQWILEDHREDWKTNVLGQCKSWLDAGLQPRAVTRDLDWGVKVPVSTTQASPNPSIGRSLDRDISEISPNEHGTQNPPLGGRGAGALDPNISEISPNEHSTQTPPFGDRGAGALGPDISEISPKEHGSQNPPFGDRGAEAGLWNYQTADPMVYGLLKNFVKELRSKPTDAEIVLWEMIRGKQLDGYKFRRQHIIGSFIADFVCLSKRLVLEVHGLIHQVPENKISDAERTLELNRLGFDVLRFTNEEVIFKSQDVLNKILESINSASPNPSKGGTLDPDSSEISHNEHGSMNPPLEGREAEHGSVNPPLQGREAEGRAAGGWAAKVLYVWFDAPIGYISATKQWALDTGKDWKPYWYSNDTKLVHFVGKDNIVFHCIIFPVMLKLHGNILPENVPANEFMNLEGDKMSTSRGWSIEMDDYINDWVKPENGGGQMVDALRYYLNAIAPETKDSEFTWKGFYDAYTSELVSIFGNFINRAMVLMHKLCKSKVPPLHVDVMDDDDKEMFLSFDATAKKVASLIEQYKFRDAQFEVIDLARKGNQYMQKKQPWIAAKSLPENPAAQKSIDNCLHICLQLTANLGILINPFLPNTAKKICHMLKVVDKMLDWENAGKQKLVSVGYNLREPQLLFRKIEQAEIDIQIEKLKAKGELVKMEAEKANPTPVSPNLPNVGEMEAKGSEPVKPEIVFEDFAKIDLKVGTIVAAEKVEKADKLLKLTVDLGFETRTIVSGIALHFKPEEIVGKQVTVVTNLAPRKMRGIESAGMILMAEDASGKLHFINPEEAINAGAGVS